MAEKKTHTIVAVDATDEAPKKKIATSAKKKVNENGQTVIEVTESGNATPYRIGAVVLWLLAITAEIIAILTVFGKINFTFLGTTTILVGLIVIDLICVIIGSLLWKKSNKIDPASKKNKATFWIWNNLGLIVAIFAFLPLIILMAKDKDKLDKKTKTVCIIAAACALVIGGLCSIDYNPISKEEKEAAEAAINQDVYWSTYGKVYHLDEDCSALNNSDTLYNGSVDAAIEKGRTRLCSFCAKRHEVNTEGLMTDGNEDAAEEEADE